MLAGRKIGLITNHTGLASDGASTVKLLNDASNVDLYALFSPEHGFAGKTWTFPRLAIPRTA